jgi:oxygen-independent coproporphyrinogen-3 oxidase
MSLTPELIARYSRPAPRYTSYPPIPAWDREIGPAEYRQALEDAAFEPEQPISLYLHLPFCPRRCLYCGCNVLITREREKLDRYLEQLGEELDLITRALGLGREVAQLHLGGGTPNYLDETQLRRLQRTITDRFTVTPGADLSVEADPRLATAEQLGLLRDLGYQRVSFGIQDLDPRVQQAIGRLQPEAQVRATLDFARAAGFAGINVDLIYGLPEQTREGFRRTVETVVELAPDRVACFGYAHVPTMQRHQRALERYRMPGGEERMALFQLAVEAFTRSGYEWIGLDHFARPEDGLAAAWRDGHLHRNFNGYTTMPAPHLIGAGMSAIGEVAGLQVQNVNDLAGWYHALAGADFATVRGHRVSQEDRRRRAAILSLMCRLELPLALAEGLEPSLARLLAYAEDGLVEARAGMVAVTPLGRYFLRTLATSFDAYLPTGGASRPMSQAV